METKTLSTCTILLPYHSFFNSFVPSSIPLPLSKSQRHSRYAAVFQAIRSPKFDFNLPNFGEDDSQRRRRRRRKSKHRRWWSDDDTDVEDAAILEQVFDSLFILQVFRSYGWFLPIILLSFLIATGPKAFLMASSIPFGLSVIIFAFQKLSEWLEGSPKPKRRRKKRSKFRGRKNVFVEEEDDLEEETHRGKRNKKRVYQSWVAQNNGSFYNNDTGSGVSVNSFGGWDDLVGKAETQAPQRPPRDTERLQRMMEKEKEKLSKSMDQRDMPLLLKLLIAVFPFMASWTNMD